LLRAAQDAVSYVDGLEIVAFMSDRKTQHAVVMCLMIIGEVVARLLDLPPETDDQFAALPLTKMRGMRNRIAHGYYTINLDVVWSTVTLELPPLIQMLQAHK
jgi:uncharacterized protein with HEPN domain